MAVVFSVGHTVAYEGTAHMLYVILFITGSIAILIGICVIDSKFRGRRRRTFIYDRTPLPDDNFLRELEVSTSLHRLCIVIRKSFADMCGVNPEMIHPDDPMEQLFGLMFDGFDEYDLWFALGTHYSNDDLGGESVTEIRKLVKELDQPDNSKYFREVCIRVAKAFGSVLAKHSIRFVPSRVEGLDNVTEAVVYPSHIELNSGGERVVFQFKNIALWPRHPWIWKLFAKFGWRPFGMCVANRDWFHPNEGKYFEFYTQPRVTIYMPADDSEVWSESLFRRIQDVMRSGGYHSNDLG